MKSARATGIIRRRILLNYRIAPDVVQPLLPPKFRPKLHMGFAIGGICLVRLEQVRPAGFPAFLGKSSENAAHRFAVLRETETGALEEAVYVPSRYTDSRINRIAGGRIFPGEHQAAKFDVKDDGNHVDLEMISGDKKVKIEVHGTQANELPRYCGFRNPEEASKFFETGALNCPAAEKGEELEAVRQKIEQWKVQPLELARYSSTYFDDQTRFPEGSVLFDCALIMRDTPHEWIGESELFI